MGRVWRDPRSLLLGWALMGAGVGVYVLTAALFVPASAFVAVGFVLSRAWRWRMDAAHGWHAGPEGHRDSPVSGWREIVAALAFIGALGAGGAGADGVAGVLGLAFAVWLVFAAFVAPRTD